MKTLRTNHVRAKNAIIPIWIILVLAIISIISKILQYNLLNDANNGITISSASVSINDIREAIISVIDFIISIISVVTFIQWFRRAYWNLHEISSNLSYSEGWAAGSWFVPVISFYRPFVIMKELFSETKRIFIQNGKNVHQNYTPTLNLWWTLWIVGAALEATINQYQKKSEDIEVLMNATIGEIIALVLSIVSCIITIKIIKMYSQLEDELFILNNDTNTEINGENNVSETLENESNNSESNDI
ncbi:MAG: DUF4328 domain-containing protein [Crocinitomicaceae bacterium]|nr:DUF4328 domain-containing protein [Crocinitomicaceae bacterium]